MRLARNQIIAIILKKKGAIAGFLKHGKKPTAMGIHQGTSDYKVRRFLEAYLEKAPIESLMPNSGQGMEESWLVHLKGGQKAIFKLENAHNEYGAHAIDRIMGFDITPVVAPRKIRMKNGVEQGVLIQWVKRGVPGDLSSFSHIDDVVSGVRVPIAPAGISPDIANAFHEMRAFDFILGNPDRHLGNFLITKARKQKLIPIDHGRSFGSNIGTTASFFAEQRISQNLYALSLDSRRKVLDGVENLLGWRRENLAKVTTAPFSIGAGDITAEQIDLVLSRAKFMERYIRAHALETPTPIPPGANEEALFQRFGPGVPRTSAMLGEGLPRKKIVVLSVGKKKRPL